MFRSGFDQGQFPDWIVSLVGDCPFRTSLILNLLCIQKIGHHFAPSPIHRPEVR